MNKVILMGRLTADPDIRYTQDGKQVAIFTLAVDRRIAKGEQKADFIRCHGWEKRAEIAEKYFHKGIKLVITGRIQTGSYKDRDGKTIYTTDVVIEDQEFAESKNADSKQPVEKPVDNEGFMPVPDDLDGLPFK